MNAPMQLIEERVEGVIADNELCHVSGAVWELGGEWVEWGAALTARRELASQIHSKVIRGCLGLDHLHRQGQIVQFRLQSVI